MIEMKRESDSKDYKVCRPGFGCAIACVLLIPLAVLLAAIRIVWCVIDRITSVT